MARTSAPRNDCRQPLRNDPCCPDCGALECLCRPRFFAGQLLSEQDLNRLDQYIRNKNRLHVRNLHGWGVVNGLMVVCDPCGDVKVTQGYAVDPCGNDIVVCEETRANLCELIRKCRQSEPQNECQPFRAPPNSNCADAEEEWVLAISYQEWQSRGVMPLRGSSCGCGNGSCNCGGSSGGDGGCGCGGASGKSSGGCGCGCGGGTKTTSMARAVQSALPAAARRGLPAQCEATVTCEGYTFSVYRKPEKEQRDDNQRGFGLEGAFWDQLRCCLQPLLDALPPMPQQGTIDPTTGAGVPATAQALAYSSWCCRFRDNLYKHFSQSRNTTCEILARLRAVSCPNPQNRDNFMQDFTRAFFELLAIWLEGIKNCICLALLPPVPQNTCDLRVPLATVKVRARDCQVLSICNWTTERKLLISWPAVTHWLSIVPIGTLLRELLDRLCCRSLLDIFDRLFDERPQPTPQPSPNDPIPGAAPAPNTVAGNFAIRSAAGLQTNVDTGANNRVETDSFANTFNLASALFSTRFSADFTAPAVNLQQLMRGFVARGRKGEVLQLGALLNATSDRFALPENGQTLNTVERKNLPLVLLAETVLRPLLNVSLGEKQADERMADLQQELSGLRTNTATAASTAADAQALRQEVESLRSELREQQALIKNLMSKLQ